LTYEDGMTAVDCLKLLLKCYAEDAIKATYYTIREFSEHESIDIDGVKIPCREYVLSANNLAKISKFKNLHSPGGRELFLGIERAIGAPALYLPDSFYASSFDVRSSDEVSSMIDRVSRRIAYAKKRLSNNGIEAPEPNTEDDSAIKVLLKIKDNYNSMEKHIAEYFLYIVRRERDKLFYIHRHPKVSNMHRCQDTSILSAINTYNWFFLNQPIFIEKGFSYGYSSF